MRLLLVSNRLLITSAGKRASLRLIKNGTGDFENVCAAIRLLNALRIPPRGVPSSIADRDNRSQRETQKDPNRSLAKTHFY